MIDLQVVGLDGEGIAFRVADSITGDELRDRISQSADLKTGAQVSLYHGIVKLSLSDTLATQGILNGATLSVVHITVDVCAAWSSIHPSHFNNSKWFALEGVTQIKGFEVLDQMQRLPQSLLSCELAFEINDALRSISST